MQKFPATGSTAFLPSLVIMLLITAAPASLASPRPQGQTTPPGGTVFGPAPASSTAVVATRTPCKLAPFSSYCRHAPLADKALPNIPVNGGTNSKGRNDVAAQLNNAVFDASSSQKQGNMQNMQRASSAASGK